MAVSIISKTQTISKLYNNGYITAYRSGNVVSINFRYTTNPTLTANAWNTLATLDEEYRPPKILDAMIVDNSGATQSATVLVARIGPAGTVQIWPFSSYAIPLGMITYVV